MIAGLEIANAVSRWSEEVAAGVSDAGGVVVDGSEGGVDGSEGGVDGSNGGTDTLFFLREPLSLSKKRTMTIPIRRVRVMHSDGPYSINNLWSIHRYWHSIRVLTGYFSNARICPIRLAIWSSRYRISFRFLVMKEASRGMRFRS